MSAKQSQITTFFSQKKKQKTNDDFDGNSVSVDILSNSVNETQGETELCAGMSSLESARTSTSASLISPSSTSAILTTAPLTTDPLTSPPLTTDLLTSAPLTSPSLTSPSSTSALLTSPSLTSPLSTSAFLISPSSTSALLTSPSSTSVSSTSKLKCEATCCTTDHSFVPQDQSDLKSSSDKRCCQLGWFSKYQWLSYCKSENKVYCYYCRRAYFGGFHPESNKVGETTLAFTSFCDWKNALARFSKHESGKIHSDCVYLVKQQQKPTVATQLSLTHQIQQAQRRRMLLIETECVGYLLRQGLALRGHVEDEGNLIQLLKLREADVNGLSSWIKEKNYLSHDIINEICQIISLSIVRELVKEISQRKIYSIICDETSDESGTEQLCFTIRSVDNDFVIHEDVLGLYMITSQSAQHITEVILDILTRCDLDIKDCRGQGYDGAPAMAGHLSGVAARIQCLCKKAFFIHCSAHSLDLALQDLTCTSSSVCIALNTTKEIVNFMKDSPKRLNLLDVLADLNNYTKLKPLCPTRWTVRASSINSLLINYSLVKTALTEISQEGGHPAPKAHGLTEQMDKFSTYFGLKLAHLIFSGTEEVSRSLQRVENNLQDVLCAVEILTKHLIRIKTDEYFIIFYQGIRAEAKSLTDEPSLPRARKPPSRFADSLPTPTLHETVYDFYHHQYFEVIDKIINSLHLRFQQSIFPLLCKVEKFILSAASGTKEGDDISLNDIQEFLADDIDVGRLERELMMLPDYFSTVNKKNNLNLKRITKISTICELLNIEQVGKTIFCEYCKLLSLYLTIPTTTATAERSFSALNRIKTYLRCTMTQQRLNHVIIPHIYKEKLDSLDLNRICSEFISKNQNRKTFFGHE